MQNPPTEQTRAQKSQSGEISMNIYQKQAFKRALDLSKRAIKISKILREGSFESRDKMIHTFSRAWSNYDDLFSIMKNLINSSSADLRDFFTQCYETYLNDYRLLKSDMRDLLSKAEASRPLRDHNNDNKIFVTYLSKVAEFEDQYADLLETGKKEKINFFFLNLNKRFTDIFGFLKAIFEVAGRTPSFDFFLTPQIRITWQILTIVDRDNLPEWNFMRLEQDRLAMELEGLYYQLKPFSNTRRIVESQLIMTFSKALLKLADYAKSESALKMHRNSLSLVDDILDAKEDNKVFGFFQKVVKGSFGVEYKNLEQNVYLMTMRNLINNSLTVLEVVDVLREKLSQNYYELSFLYQFLKKFVLKIVMVEIYKRVVVYERTKKKLILKE